MRYAVTSLPSCSGAFVGRFLFDLGPFFISNVLTRFLPQNPILLVMLSWKCILTILFSVTLMIFMPHCNNLSLMIQTKSISLWGAIKYCIGPALLSIGWSVLLFTFMLITYNYLELFVSANLV